MCMVIFPRRSLLRPIRPDGKLINEEIMKVALDQAEGGRLHILGEMSRALTGAHAELGEHAPRIEQIKIPTDKIHDMIGTGGNQVAA